MSHSVAAMHSDRKLRILVVANNYPPFHGGGYGLHCQWYAEELGRRGHTIQILTSRPNSSAVPEGSEGSLEVKRNLIQIPDRTAVPLRLYRTHRNRLAVKQAVADFRPDIVYCHGISGVGFQVYHTATESGVPSMSTVGDTWLAQAWADLPKYDPWNALATGKTSRGPRRWIKRRIGEIGSLLGLYIGERPACFHPSVVISNYIFEALRAASAPMDGRVVVVPPIMPECYFRPDGEPIGRLGSRTKQLRALFVGRMELLKGPDTAIEGIARAVQAGSDVTLTLAGLPRDNIKDILQARAEKLGIASRVIWAGTPTTAELISLYRRHDVFLFPSRIREGFGLVNSEAMACGLPVIGTTISGSADIIRHGVSGYGIALDDDEGLATHLCAMFQDRDLLETLSRGALEMAKKHHPSRIGSLIESCLYQAISIKQGRQTALVAHEDAELMAVA